MADSFHSTYVADGMRAGPFLPFGFGDAGDRARRVAMAAERRCAPQLVDEVRAQQARLPSSAARDAHVEALARAGTVVVATGQQVGLFLGPLYTLYKAATAIVVAKQLERETGRRAVPIFWLQTEDHDFDEIARCSVPREGAAPLVLALDDDPAAARTSIAGRALGREIAARLDALDDALAGAAYAGEVSALVRAHYRPGASIAGAFAGVLAQLFADEGLIVFDPRRVACARLVQPILRAAISDCAKLDALLAARGEALRAAGFAEQIRVRAGSPLAFFHAGSAAGPRHRLVPDGARLRLSGADENSAHAHADGANGGALDEAAVLAALDEDPLRASTSALLRPITQDTLFPTAAYVGGPAEVDYFAQVAAIYPAFGLAPPLIVPRARFRLIPPPARRLLDELRLRPNELDEPRELLDIRLTQNAPLPQLRQNDPPNPLGQNDAATRPSENWAAELDARLDAYGAAARDPGTRRLVARARASLHRNLARLARRDARLAVERDEALHRRLARLADWLRPGGAPQERVHSFPAFAARAGTRALVAAVLAAVDPFDPSLKELAP